MRPSCGATYLIERGKTHMDYMKDWEKTKQRFAAFWRGEYLDRCCIAVTAPMGPPLPKPGPDAPQEELVRYWTDGEAILQRSLAQFERTYFAGDAFPQIFLNLGAAGHAAFFRGADYRFADTVWFTEWIHDIETDAVAFDPAAPLYRKTLELARFFATESRGRFLVSMPDTCGNLDALAHMRGNENLLLDLYDAPEWIERTLPAIQQAWERVISAVYEAVRDVNDGGSCVGWLNTWAPGLHAQMQCDFSVMISPQDYARFVMPELRAQCARLDYALYHLDGMEQTRFLDLLLAQPDLRAIQWTWVEGQPSPVEFLPVLRRIQQAGKGLVLPGCALRDLPELLEGLSARGLLICAEASSPEEVDAAVRLAERLAHA